MNIVLTESKIDVSEVIAKASAAGAGAIDVFLGTVRNNTSNKKVVRLEYEAYDNMALKEMEKLAAKVADKWPVKGIAIYHRKGILDIGDVAVAIAVSTPHRKDAFEACQFAIDTLKQTVPIWKKEVFENGETWVSAFP